MTPDPAGPLRPDPRNETRLPHPEAAPHIRLDLYQERSSAVTATITGAPTRTIHALLAIHGFEPLDEQTMVMARIDREEPHYAEQATRALRAENITVDITPELRDEIDTEWTWANYPMPWCSREEIREVSNDAQKIYDDIRHGRLIIHAHAHDGWTTVAVGTYRDGPSIHLHGESHLRTESTRYDNPVEAITEFDRLYGDAVRPGPAPATSTEHEAERARTSLPGAADTQPAPATTGLVDAHAAAAGSHEALLDDFLESHGEWEKWRTWDDSSTVANHESLTLRALFDHEAQGRDNKWTLAAYETPVSERLWSATATASTPAEIVLAMLNSAASESAWGPSASLTETTIIEATRPLADAGWKQTIEGRYIRWDAPGKEAAGIQFDSFAVGQRPDGPLPTWTVWGGNTVHQPTWALELSAHVPAPLLQDIAFELAEGRSVRSLQPIPPRGPALRTAQADTTVPPPAPFLPGRRR
ncbi:DUF317 domain-containing protein [Streptomyces sp. wa1063]|uniref:DUF317 domain-containing protein n=1 Tax=Streptomyces sp. wa1063 TaxID=1828212 RepID=UPI000BEF2C3F|nr:DUF317 domain-containing protein [Streptomyces sp. wa1063]